MATRPADDNYPTPPEVTRALLSVERFGGDLWEPCAGDGELAAELRRQGHTVAATTIGQGRGGSRAGKHRVEEGIDALACQNARHPNIVTNPPYSLNEVLIPHLLGLPGVCKVALLLSVGFLGSERRYRGIHATCPPSRVWFFADRIALYPAGWEGRRNGPKQGFAWFVWDLPRQPGLFQGGWLYARDFMAGRTR